MSKKSNRSFLQRMRFKYKISILNENTLEEMWHIRLSKMSVFITCFLVAILYFFLIAFLIIKTPLRGFLPGYTENINLRKQLIVEAMQVDSMAEALAVQTQYLESVRRVLSSEVEVDSSTTFETLKNNLSFDDTRLAPGERELAYRDSFEESEKANLSLINEERIVMERNYLMHPPAKGLVVESFNLRSGVYGVKVNVGTGAEIMAVLDGIVVSVSYSFDNKYELCMQHGENFVSIYRFAHPFLKRVGDKAHAGEIIATVRGDEEAVVSFELWKDGVAMDPQSFILF